MTVLEWEIGLCLLEGLRRQGLLEEALWVAAQQNWTRRRPQPPQEASTQ